MMKMFYRVEKDVVTGNAFMVGKLTPQDFFELMKGYDLAEEDQLQIAYFMGGTNPSEVRKFPVRGKYEVTVSSKIVPPTLVGEGVTLFPLGVNIIDSYSYTSRTWFLGEEKGVDC